MSYINNSEKIIRHVHKFVPHGINGNIQYNDNGVLGSSDKFKYIGNDLYVSELTSETTPNIIYYNEVDGKLTYGKVVIPDIMAGDGMSFDTIKSSGSISLGKPSSIDSDTDNTVSTGTHTHKFIPSGLDTYIQYNSNGVLSGSTNFTFDGINIYNIGMGKEQTSFMVYFEPITGKISYGDVLGGSVISVKSGNGMDFTDIEKDGLVNLGTPSDITSSSSNLVTGTTHTHKFIPYGEDTQIQFNSKGELSSSSNLTFDGKNLNVKGKILQNGKDINNLFDKYNKWILSVETDGLNNYDISSQSIVTFKGGKNINLEFSANNNTITIDSNYTRENAFKPLVSGHEITWDYSLGYNVKVTLTNINSKLTLLNVPNGGSGKLIVTQDSDGSKSISTWPANSKFENGSLSIPTTPNSICILSFIFDGSAYYWSIKNDYR